MSWTDKVGDLLKHYTGVGAAAAAQTAPDVHAHFDEVAQAVPSNVLAEGLTAAFNSDKTPAFGQMLSTLFNNSTGDQKAGLINQLLGSISPSMLTQVLGGAGLAGLLGGAGSPQVTAQQAQQLSPEVVQQLANHAQNSNPSIVDTVSNFYAQHATLVKTLGGAALTVALAKVAERQRQA
jgi:hypothetical protein